jgi:hypothetical protein
MAHPSDIFREHALAEYNSNDERVPMLDTFHPMRCPHCRSACSKLDITDFSAEMAADKRTVQATTRAFRCDECGSTWKAKAEIFDLVTRDKDSDHA